MLQNIQIHTENLIVTMSHGGVDMSVYIFAPDYVYNQEAWEALTNHIDTVEWENFGSLLDNVKIKS